MINALLVIGCVPLHAVKKTRVVVADGTLDASFNNPNGFITTAITTPVAYSNASANGVYVHIDGTIAVCGNNDAAQMPATFTVAQYLTNGTLNPAFGAAGIAQIVLSETTSYQVGATGIATQSDGKIVVVGYIQVGGAEDADPQRQPTSSQMFAARLLPTGALDATFNPTGTPPGINFIPYFNGEDLDAALAVVIDVNGNIVIAGSTTDSDSNNSMALARLTKNGVLDTTFNPLGTIPGELTIAFGDNSNDQGSAVALAADGQTIYIAGSSQPNIDDPTPANFAFAQVSSTGAILHMVQEFFTADPATDGVNSACQAVLVQPNGYIVLVGWAFWTDGNTYFALQRFQNNVTSLDTTFTGGATNKSIVGGTVVVPAVITDNSQLSEAFGAGIQNDGKILAAGFGPEDADDDLPGDQLVIARFLTDGAPDATFAGDSAAPINPGFVFTQINSEIQEDEAFALSIQGDFGNGNVVIAGLSVTSGDFGTSDFVVARYLVDDPAVPLVLPTFVSPGPVFTPGVVTFTGNAQNPSIIDLFLDSISDTGAIGSTVTMGSANTWSFTAPVATGTHTAYAVGRYRDDGHVNLQGSLTFSMCTGFSATSYYGQLITNVP